MGIGSIAAAAGCFTVTVLAVLTMGGAVAAFGDADATDGRPGGERLGLLVIFTSTAFIAFGFLIGGIAICAS